LRLWHHLPIILRRIVAHDRCALCCDYDGTLTPIVADPAAAHLDPVMQQVLAVLARHPRYRVVVVSGRALADLRLRVTERGLYLAGNHGLEIAGPGITYHHPEARRFQPQITALVQALRYDLAEFPGAWVEDKGLTLTVHVRQVPAACLPAVEQRVLRRVRPILAAQQCVLRTGKAVLEVRPAVPWDKGTAVCRLVDHVRTEAPAACVLPIYIGDDNTDEDAFRALATAGLGIVVGEKARCSAAHYALESVAQVTKFLALLSALGNSGRHLERL
jgi:trehalose 6-phosphate phosphatase